MSFVIKRAKQHYARALNWEALILVASFVLWSLIKSEVREALLLGMLASFVPHCFFVYWVFFRKLAKNGRQVTAFYRGEAIKWALTILFIVASFKCTFALNVIEFFMGYFLAIGLNIALPPMLNKVNHRSL